MRGAFLGVVFCTIPVSSFFLFFLIYAIVIVLILFFKFELQRFGKIVSGMTLIPLGCKKEALKHVLSFRWQLFMVLESPTLDISFQVKHEDKSYMIYASTIHLKCFECGNFGHKKN